MSVLILGGVGVDVRSPFQYTNLNLGPEERAQCGNLWGYNLGSVKEGTNLIPCRTYEDACDIQTIITGQGESYLFQSLPIVGSLGNEINVACSLGAPTVTTQVGPFGSTVPTLSLGFADAACLPLGIDVAANEEWTIDVWGEFGGTWVHIQIAGNGTTQTSLVIDGVPAVPPLGLIAVQPTGDVIFFGPLNYYNMNFYKGRIIQEATLIAMHDVTTDETISDAGFPFVTMAGDLFKQDFKVKVSVTDIDRRPFKDPVTGIEHNNGAWITFLFRQVLPSFVA